MAQTQANIKLDIWELYIDDVIAPFYTLWSVSENLDLKPITTQRYGSTPIAMLVQGQKCDMSFTFQELSVADMMRWNGIAGAAALENPLPALGTQLPTHSIRMHNPADGADTTRDIYMPKVSFGGFVMSADGVDEAEQVVPATALLDVATGVLSQIGWVAGP